MNYGHVIINGQASFSQVTPELLHEIVRAMVPADGQWHEFAVRVMVCDGAVYIDRPATLFIDCRFQAAAGPRTAARGARCC